MSERHEVSNVTDEYGNFTDHYLCSQYGSCDFIGDLESAVAHIVANQFKVEDDPRNFKLANSQDAHQQPRVVSKVRPRYDGRR